MSPAPLTCLWKPSLHRSSACQPSPCPRGRDLHVPRAFWPPCPMSCVGPSYNPCSHLLHSSQIIPLHGVRGTSKPATETWDGRMGQLILIILYINNLQIICKFGNSLQHSNVTLLLLPHSSGCLSHSLVFPCLKLDCKWSGKRLGPPLPRTAPRSHCSSNNK